MQIPVNIGHPIERMLSRSIFSLPVVTAFMFAGFFTLTASAQSRRVAPTPTPEKVEKVDTEEIILNVLAFDERGNFFPDVTERDLVITENNVLHQPTSVRRLPANVVIVMDAGGELRSIKNLDQTRKAAAALVRSLRDGDQMALVVYSDKAEIVQEWTDDKSQMLSAIGRSNFGRKSDLVTALRLSRELLTRNPAHNRHVVLITDGTDSVSSTSAKSDEMQRLSASDISVHVLAWTAMEAEDIEPRTKGVSNSPPPKAMPDEVAAQLPNGARDAATAPRMKTINLDRSLLRKLRSRKADLEASEIQLEKLSVSTNGEFILPDSPDELIEKAPLVARMIDSVYVVTYMPKLPVVGTRGIAERNIEVTSKRPGLIVQARRKLLIENRN